MTFKIKDGVAIGTTNIFNNSGQQLAPVVIGSAQYTPTATTQDGIKISGRAGGTGSFRVELIPTTLTANRTITLPDTTGTLVLSGNNLSVFAATTSAQLAGVISDETGSGALVFGTSPSLTTPSLGVATATSINKVAITAPANSATLTIADAKTLTASNTLTFTGTDGSSVAFGAGGTVAYTGNNLSVFAATTSAQLAGVISDETGSDKVVFNTSPTFATSIDGGATFAAFGSSTALTLGYNSTAASTTNISTGAVGDGITKTINIGTGGAANSTTNINLGAVGGTLTLGTGTVVGTLATQNVFNSTATTVNFAGAATRVYIGSLLGGGITNFRHNLEIGTGNPGSLSTVVITGTAGQFSCAETTLSEGDEVVISGIYGGGGSITGYSNPTTYYIIATNGSTTFTLSATYGGSAITTTAGTPTGLTYTLRRDSLKLMGGNGLGTTISTFNLLTKAATTINFGSAATAFNIGATTGTVTINNPTVVGTQTTVNLWNATSTTVNAFGAATTLNMGAGSGTTTVNNNLTVSGNLTVNGTTTTVNSTTTTLDDPIFTLGGDTSTVETSKDRGIEAKWAGATITISNYIGNGTTTVTGTVASTTGYAEGDVITISGASGTEQTKLNGTWTIASVPNATTFTFVVGSSVAAGTYTTTLGTTVKSKNAFFGLDQSTGKFTFIPQSKNVSETFSGTKGEIDATVDWSNITGDTTVGSNLVTLANPSAIAFIRINADNTVTALSDVNFRTAIGAGTGNGTVTSVSGTANVVAVATGTTTPVISLIAGHGDTTNPYASKTANHFLAAPNGSAGAPTFRAIVAADIPTLNQNTTGTAANVTGTVAIANGGTGQTTAQAAINALAGATTSGQYLRGNGTNVVMSAIQAGDVPTLNQNTTGTAANVTGTVAVANGGTGQTTYTDGQLLIGNTSGNTLTKATLTAGTGVSITNGNGSITIAATGLTAEADTLATVTGRGNTTSTNVQLNNAELILAPSTTARIYKRAVQPNAITTVNATTIDSWATATYRSAKYTIQIVQGNKYQLSEVYFTHNDTNVYLTEYAVVENSSIPATISASIASGTLSLQVTITDANTTNATVTMERTLFAI